mgnify:FL=1|tara:strand:- start:1337 stop:2377 length:1041 start_codon:yes stop_codon:yes gene_type:complete
MKNPFRKTLDESLEQLETGAVKTSFIAGLKLTVVSGVLIGITCLGLGFYWSQEPEIKLSDATNLNQTAPTGTATVKALQRLGSILLNKPGGYLSNDLFPPGVLLDNVPNWEFGVLVQVRDLARALRNTLSRSQSQSREDPDLVIAENQFYFDNNSWFLPETEGEYQKGLVALDRYLLRLGDPGEQQAQFYARADNLSLWLGEVETRLGSLSQRLSASVGKRQLNTGLAGDSAAQQSTTTADEQELKTPWLELDDIFYEARGSTWAILVILRAVEQDFGLVLEKKNARVSLRQIIRELEPTQDPLWSPMILNGSGLGLLANHSLVMASHISRANAAMNDLRQLLEQG